MKFGCGQESRCAGTASWLPRRRPGRAVAKHPKACGAGEGASAQYLEYSILFLPSSTTCARLGKRPPIRLKVQRIFDISPIRVRPDPTGDVTIESGDRSAKVLAEEEPPRRPNPKPPFGVQLIRDNELVASLERPGGDVDPEEEAGILRQWIDDQGIVDSLVVEMRASRVTVDQLNPLVTTARECGIPIDVHLTEDG